MDVLYVSESINEGGAFKTCTHLAKNIKSKNKAIKIDLATLSHSMISLPVEDVFDALYEDVSVNDMRVLITSGKYNVIHWWKSSVDCVFRKVFKNIGKRPPLLMTLCQVPSRAKYGLSISNYKYTNKVVFVCKAAMRHWRVRDYPYDDSEMIYFGTFCQSFRNEKRERKYSCFNGIVYGRGSSLGKCPTWAIDAFAGVGIDNSKFIIVGSGKRSDKKRLLKKIVYYNIEDKVELVGQLGEKEWLDTVADLDIFFYGLEKKGFSAIDGTMQDAMLMGIPIVYLGPPGPAELIEHGKTGYIAKNYNEFVRYANKLANDKEKRDEFGCRARDRIYKIFSYEMTVQKYVSLYVSMIDENNKKMTMVDRKIPLKFIVVRSVDVIVDKIISLFMMLKI